jgi:hypothetical protein
MDLLIVVVFLGLGGLLVRWAASAEPLGDALLAGLFRAPKLGWPSGVEDEDDQRAGAGRARPADPADPPHGPRRDVGRTVTGALGSAPLSRGATSRRASVTMFAS